MADERLSRFLDEARSRYLAHYRDVVRRAKAERPQAVAEVLIELSSTETTLLRRLTRVDVIWGGAEKPSIIEANIPPVSTDKCLYSDFGPPIVHAYPLVWNDCEVVCPEPIDLGVEFMAWFERWLDVEDVRDPDEYGLAGVIHSVTIPGFLAGAWGFSVDLGSAPVEAVIDFLALPAFRRVRALDLGSFTYGQ